MTPHASEWIMDSGCTNHMTGDRSLLMDSTLRPSDKSHITFADTSRSKVLGLGRVAISKDQHMDKVMLVEISWFQLNVCLNALRFEHDCDISKISLPCSNAI